MVRKIARTLQVISAWLSAGLIFLMAWSPQEGVGKRLIWVIYNLMMKITPDEETAYNVLVGGPYLAVLLLSVLVILTGIKFRGDWRRHLSTAFRTKLLLIPFFLLDMVLGVALFVTGMFLVTPLLFIPLLILSAWLVMLSTSLDVLQSLWAMCREGSITTKSFVLHVVCQLIFVLDVVDAWILCRKAKKVPSQQE